MIKYNFSNTNHVFRHYQGEAYQYYTIGRKQTWSTVDDLVHFSNKTPIPWKDLTHFNYTPDPGRIEMSAAKEAPPVTMYTYFSLDTCLVGFWVFMLIQACLIIVAKKCSNPGPFQRQNWVKRITHALENCQIPVPMEDWDDHQGTIEHYIKAQKQVMLEMKWTLLVNLLINLSMCIPMTILGK